MHCFFVLNIQVLNFLEKRTLKHKSARQELPQMMEIIFGKKHFEV